MRRGRRPTWEHTPPPGTGPQTDPRIIPARYPGRCISCGAAFVAGAEIAYFDLIGKALCPGCTVVWKAVEKGEYDQ